MPFHPSAVCRRRRIGERTLGRASKWSTRICDRLEPTKRERPWRNWMPGELSMAIVKPGKQWTYAGHPYPSGEIESSRLGISALGLVPLKLHGRGLWTPEEHYWGEKREPIEAWAKPVIARGPRQSFESARLRRSAPLGGHTQPTVPVLPARARPVPAST